MSAPSVAASTSVADEQPVVIVTGGSQGIGAGIVAAYRELGWSVVATARTIAPSEDLNPLTIDGDLSVTGTADRIVSAPSCSSRRRRS
jgi:NAD(P)-dependent dehydrogenase (short-subunit alcohol dehydrogenase family)